MAKISITRSLVKLKTLDSKIQKSIKTGCFITYKVGDKVREDCSPKEDFQSVMDLINFRDTLKAKVAESNAKTKVKIAGKKYSVTEAIETKQSIQYRQYLLQELRQQNARVNDTVEDINQDVQRRLDRLIESSLGSDKSKAKDEVESITKTFLQRNQADVVDELKIEETIKKLDEEITSFLEQIDVTLSEINATTYIEV